MTLKFREKTFIITLALFLLFFNGGIFSLGYYTYKKSADGAERICLAEERVISDAFEKDMDALQYGITPSMVMFSYSDFYSEKNVYLQFSSQNKIIYSNLPQGLKPPGNNMQSTQRTDGARYFLISEVICDGGYTLVYAKNVSYLDEDFKSIATVFILCSLCASLILAAVLFFVLRKLVQPLEKLSDATKALADGDLSVRAEISGNDEISLLAKDFNAMARHISEQMEELKQGADTKQTMLDNLAHEMRTPLTSIRGYAEYLLNANISEDDRLESVQYIISEAERLKLIGERLLDEAFIRENGIRPCKTDVNALIKELLKILRHKAQAAGVEMVSEAEPLIATADPLLLSLLVTNLADNAIKSCKHGGKVTIGCREEKDFKQIYVADSGLGMTEEQLSHITEPFYRTDQSRSRKDGGTGLGLSLCKRIADAHKGELIFSSVLQKGTVVTFRFNPDLAEDFTDL